MKDIVITSKIAKREFFVWLGCFIFAFLLNVGAVIYYKTSWVEIFSQLGYVVIISIACYLLVALVRFVCFGIRKLTRKKR